MRGVKYALVCEFLFQLLDFLIQKPDALRLDLTYDKRKPAALNVIIGGTYDDDFFAFFRHVSFFEIETTAREYRAAVFQGKVRVRARRAEAGNLADNRDVFQHFFRLKNPFYDGAKLRYRH